MVSTSSTVAGEPRPHPCQHPPGMKQVPGWRRALRPGLRLHGVGGNDAPPSQRPLEESSGRHGSELALYRELSATQTLLRSACQQAQAAAQPSHRLTRGSPPSDLLPRPLAADSAHIQPASLLRHTGQTAPCGLCLEQSHSGVSSPHRGIQQVTHARRTHTASPLVGSCQLRPCILGARPETGGSDGRQGLRCLLVVLSLGGGSASGCMQSFLWASLAFTV